MICKIGHVCNTDPKEFAQNLWKNLQEHKEYAPEVQYQMCTLPNGRIQYSALIFYR